MREKSDNATPIRAMRGADNRCGSGALNKVASQANLWYNKHINIVVPGGVRTTPGRIHLIRRCIVDTVSPYASQSKPNPETTSIYVLVDPITEQVRYVGKSNNPQRRFAAHIKYLDAQTHKVHWIKGLIAKGLLPELHIIEECPIAQWQKQEIYWIAYYRGQGIPLTNGSDGGEGIINPTPEDRIKRSENTRRIMSDESERKRRLSKLHSPEAKAKRKVAQDSTSEDVKLKRYRKISKNKREYYSSKDNSEKYKQKKYPSVQTSSLKPGQHLSSTERNLIQSQFLEAFSQLGNVRTACGQVGIDRSTIYRWLANDTRFSECYQQISGIHNAAGDRQRRHYVGTQRLSLQKEFLDVFALIPNVRFAAKQIGVDHTTIYRWRQSDAEFNMYYVNIECMVDGEMSDE